MRPILLALPAAIALSTAGCGNRPDPANQLSTEASFDDEEISAALGGTPSPASKAAGDQGAGTDANITQSKGQE
jgi:hypothetical protein